MKKQEYEHTLGLKIDGEIDAKTIYYIKKETDLSLSEIKQKVKNNDYILESIVGDFPSLQHINRMKRKLSDMGASCRLFQDDEEQTSEFFDNIEQRHIEISKEYDDFDY